MSLFKKPKKQIQRRVLTENSDEDEPMEEEVQTVPTIKKPGKSKKDKKPKQSILSFETEEEGEVFQVKKSSHHKKVMKMFEKEKHKKKEPKSDKEGKNKDKTEIITDDLVLVVNPSHKKPPTPPPPILSGRDALCAGKDDLSSEEDDENINSGSHRFSKPNNFKKVLESGAIPDAAMIHAARKKRQRAREMGDMIPLEEEKETDNTGGRLQREDEHDESDDERIDMDLNHKVRDIERRREQFYAAQESDQEIDEWEDQQIRKGVTGAAVALAQELMMNSEQLHQQIVIPAPVIEPGVPRTPQMIMEKLKEHYEEVCSSRDNHVERLDRIQEEIKQLTNEMDELKLRAPKSAERFRFYQELRGFITDLVECLDEKIGRIMALEQKAMDLQAKRSEWFIERRRQDVRDQAEEVTNKLNPRKVPDDEMKVRRAAEREGRRTRRRRARELVDQATKHVEGMSSDDEISQQEEMNFNKEQELIENEAKEVLEDVTDDYSSIANILIKFEHWREYDVDSYNEAYATLCLPKVVSPFVRLEMLLWNPLLEGTDLEKLPWYRTLALYGLHDDETESTLSRDPDINILPTLVEKLIIPKLVQLVDRCWDPLSSSQTLRLLSVVTRYIRKFPTLGPACKPLINLFHAILYKMKTSLEHDVFIPMSPKLADSKSHFFQRQFASGMKLLKNITSWQGVLNDNTLKELALTSLMNRYLLTSLKFCMLTDAVSKVYLMTQILPRIWLQSNIPELQLFKTSVMGLLQQLDKNCPLHLE